MALERDMKLMAELQDVLRLFERDDVLERREQRPNGDGVYVFITRKQAIRIRETLNNTDGPALLPVFLEHVLWLTRLFGTENVKGKEELKGHVRALRDLLPDLLSIAKAEPTEPPPC